MTPLEQAASSTPSPGPGPGPHAGGVRDWLTRVLVVLVITALLGVIFGPFTPESVGAAAIGLMLVLVFVKVPVGVSLILPALAGLFALYGQRSALNLLTQLPFEAIATWQYSVIPMFVLMGLLLWRSGITEQLYRLAGPTVGRLPGGLAIGSTGVGTGLAAVSGSTIGVVYALARIGIPEMLKAGYHKSLAVGSVVVAGLPGQIIPPSIFLIIYAGIAKVPVGPQLIAGVGPGLALGLLFSVTVIGLAVARPGLLRATTGSGTGAGGTADADARGSDARAEKDTRPAMGVGGALAVVLPVFGLVLLVLGGMFAGFFTATEAGAAGALGALLLTLVRRARHRDSVAAVSRAGRETLAAVGNIFFLLIGAQALARLIAVSGLGTEFATWVGNLDISRVQFLLILMVAYLVMGTAMDPLSIMLLTVPLLLPVIGTLGISPLWFGVFVVLFAEMAIVSPPIGVLAFIVHDIVRDPEVNLGVDISLPDVFRAIAIFFPAVLVLVAVMIGVPELATWLPSQMGDEG